MSGDQLDLDAIAAQTQHRAQWGDDAHCDTILALVAEVRRLRARVEELEDDNTAGPFVDFRIKFPGADDEPPTVIA